MTTPLPNNNQRFTAFIRGIGSYMYANDTCICYQKQKNVLKKEELLLLCERFTDNKSSIHLGEDKTEIIIFFE